MPSMPLPPDYLDAIADARDPSLGPLIMPWPMPGDPASMLQFSTFAEWRSFIFALSLRRAVPEIVAAKFESAQNTNGVYLKVIQSPVGKSLGTDSYIFYPCETPKTELEKTARQIGGDSGSWALQELAKGD